MIRICAKTFINHRLTLGNQYYNYVTVLGFFSYGAGIFDLDLNPIAALSFYNIKIILKDYKFSFSNE